MTPKKRITVETRVAVECAIARGHRIERICDDLDVPPELVQAVWNHLDALELPDIERTAGRVATSAFNMWQRLAREYRAAIAAREAA